MASYSSRKRTVVHHEWTVPAGSTHTEFFRAYNAARQGYLQANKLPEDAELFDDALWIHVDEDTDGPQVVIAFTTEETS
jgi:hypothetical protein